MYGIIQSVQMLRLIVMNGFLVNIDVNKNCVDLFIVCCFASDFYVVLIT